MFPVWIYLLALPLKAEVSLANIDFGRCGQARKMAADAGGSVFVLGRVSECAGNDQVLLVKLNAENEIVWSFRFGGSAYEEPINFAIHPDGGILVVGQTYSSDLPVLNPLPGHPAGIPNQSAVGFLFKVDGAGEKLALSTYLGSSATAVAVDRQGQIYIGGNTFSADFPTTQGAFQTSGAGYRSFGSVTYAFLMKLNPQADRVLFSTLLGGAGNSCSGSPSGCIGTRGLGFSSVDGLHVDDRGQVLVLGRTSSPEFPVTENAFMKRCPCANWSTAGFLVKFNSTGSALLWSTYFGSPPFGFDRYTFSGTVISDFAIARDGGIVLAGQVGSLPFQTTPGALQEAFHGRTEPFDFSPTTRKYDGFVSKLSSDGSRLVYSTFFGGSEDDSLASIVLTADESALVSGVSQSPDLPATAGTISLGEGLVAMISPDAGKLRAQHKLPAGIGSRQIRLDSSGSLVLLGSSGSIVRASLDELPHASLLGIQDLAADSVLSRIAPGEMLQLTGARLGPERAVAMEPASRFPTEWDGYQVLFNGKPAPIVYLDSHTLRTVAPFSLYGQSDARITLITPRGETKVQIAVVDSQPFLLLRPDGTAVAINEDGSIHSQSNPATRGSNITLFVSGLGPLDPTPEDGVVITIPPPKPALPFVVRQDNSELTIVEAYAVPGQVAGIAQITVRCCATTTSTSAFLYVTQNGISNNSARIWIRR